MNRLRRNWESIVLAACIVLINGIILTQIGLAYGHYNWTSYLGAYGVYGPGNPIPTLTHIGPNARAAGSASFTLTITGTNFISASVVRWNGSNRNTTYASSTQLRATITKADVASPRVVYVTVFNPTPGGGTSNAQPFYVTLKTTAVIAWDAQTGLNPRATTGTRNGVTATATGTGTVSVAQFAGNPAGTASFNSAGAYFDVNIAPGSSFTSLTIVDCALNGGKRVYWWNGTAWLLASDQTYNVFTRCVTIVVTNSTIPSLRDLTGTPFGAADDSFDYMPYVER